MATAAGPALSGERPTAIAVLIAGHEEANRELCREVSVNAGFQARTASTAEEALQILQQYPVDILMADLRVPQMGGIALLKRVLAEHPRTAVMMVMPFVSAEQGIEAARTGAADYVTKPFNLDDLRARLGRVARAVETDQENRVLREQLRTKPGLGDLIGLSRQMQRVYRMIQKVCEHNYPVLILGESGTGKELVARSIHFSGARSNKPFVPVDCSAFVPTLIESELFGYVKGAFTGAVNTKQGLMEAAGSGTLFLDEIGELPLDLQAKLLRALQEKEVWPVGSTERIGVAARVIAATNRNLDSAVRDGLFRQDLFFRLNVVQIKLPSLRERKTDIPILVNAFLQKFSDSGALPQRAPLTISSDTMARLLAYDWPGNVRELENAIERAVALSSGPVLQTSDLPSNLQYDSAPRIPLSDDTLSLEELERRAIFSALRESSGDKLAAARRLGIGKTTLYRKLKQYDSQSNHLASGTANPSGNVPIN